MLWFHRYLFLNQAFFLLNNVLTACFNIHVWQDQNIKKNLHRGIRKPIIQNEYPTKHKSKKCRISIFFFFKLTLALCEMCPNTEFFLMRIFPDSDWIRRNTSYLSVFIRMRENTDQKRLRIWTLFTQCSAFTVPFSILQTVHPFQTNFSLFQHFVHIIEKY